MYVSSPTNDLVAVRWQRNNETGTLLYGIEEFAREWEQAGTGNAKWKLRAGAIAAAAVCGIGLYLGLRAWESERAGRVAAAARQPAGVDGSAADDGALAALACSRGADEYLRSVTDGSFKWAYGATPDERFNEQVAVHVAPGITTSVSDKLLMEDSSGAFRRVELVCSYDIEDRKVLRYWIANGEE